jgi:hypothetical protein
MSMNEKITMAVMCLLFVAAVGFGIREHNAKNAMQAKYEKLQSFNQEMLKDFDNMNYAVNLFKHPGSPMDMHKSGKILGDLCAKYAEIIVARKQSQNKANTAGK